MGIRRGDWIVTLAIVIVLLQTASAADFTYVVSNSENWRDTYSTLHYARLTGTGSDFLVSPQHGPLLLSGIAKENDIRVISSREQPFVINYMTLVNNAGFSGSDELVLDNPNIELAEELPDVRNFIIVGSLYGYNAVAVAPYAVQSKSWVFFADRSNIDEIVSFLDGRNLDNLLIYGDVDAEIIESLETYDPEIIDTGDRFKDNIEIVEKYLEIHETSQVILTNGEFIEKEIMSGAEPLLFTGKENVPTQIQEYLKESDTEVGVLIGSDLVGAATNIRRSTGISVIVKFARGARVPTGSVSSVEGLDLFYLPVPVLNLTLHSVTYNRATNRLEVTYQSVSNAPIYFKGTLTIDQGGDTSRVGDAEPVFIAPNAFKTISYSDVRIDDAESTKVDVFTLYGETSSALEKILQGTYSIKVTNVLDRCDVSATKVTYSKPKEAFVIKLKNDASVDCWADVELTDVLIGLKKRTLGSEGAVKVKAGGTQNAIIYQPLSERDIEKNNMVDLVAYYGEREDGLVKMFQGRFPLGVQTISTLTIILTILAIMLLLFILLILFRRRNREE